MTQKLGTKCQQGVQNPPPHWWDYTCVLLLAANLAKACKVFKMVTLLTQ